MSGRHPGEYRRPQNGVFTGTQLPSRCVVATQDKSIGFCDIRCSELQGKGNEMAGAWGATKPTLLRGHRLVLLKPSRYFRTGLVGPAILGFIS